MRKVEKQVEIGQEIIRNNPKLDLQAPEVKELLSNTEFVAIRKAFLMGLAVGYRNAGKGIEMFIEHNIEDATIDELKQLLIEYDSISTDKSYNMAERMSCLQASLNIKKEIERRERKGNDNADNSNS